MPVPTIHRGIRRTIAKRLLHSLRLVRAVQYVRRRGLRVLMYHRFPDAAGTLEGQCEHLRRRYCPVTLTQVAQAFASGEALPPNAVAVTVDDGYRDFLLRGYPVFRRFHIVPTVFLVSDFVDGKRWMPGDTLAYALQQTRASTVEFDAPDGAHRTFPITTADGRSIAHRHICDALKRIGEPARRRAFEDLVRTLHVEVPATPTPERRGGSRATEWSSAPTRGRIPSCRR
jgi:hypothetical protein